jgi:hypothetical protein
LRKFHISCKYSAYLLALQIVHSLETYMCKQFENSIHTLGFSWSYYVDVYPRPWWTKQSTSRVPNSTNLIFYLFPQQYHLISCRCCFCISLCTLYASICNHLPACEGAQNKVRLWLASQYAQNLGETNFWDLRF